MDRSASETVVLEVMMEKIAEGVYRLGSRRVNFYFVEDGDAITVVDTGFPGYFGQAISALEELGRKPSDIKAVVLTHTHSDHIGAAPKLAEDSGAPVLVHRGEAPIATGKKKPAKPKGFVGSLWRPRMLSFLGHAIANKGAAVVTVPNATAFDEDDVLDVPGKLRVVFTPGHSSGHSALLLEDRRILFCGDAMATLAVDTGATGPMVHPFNEDQDMAVASLAVLEKIDADVLLPGHGEPWRGRISDAVSQARSKA
jgi:glyoxylase-like metal-dependent hydrolase (beta-lactamase superfamily II)